VAEARRAAGWGALERFAECPTDTQKRDRAARDPNCYDRPGRLARRQAVIREWRLEAKLPVRGLAAALLTSSETLFLLEVLRVASLVLVDVSTGDAGTELPVPIILDDHETTTAGAPLRWGADQHGSILWLNPLPATRRWA
jgi:hypothetical protein